MMGRNNIYLVLGSTQSCLNVIGDGSLAEVSQWVACLLNMNKILRYSSALCHLGVAVSTCSADEDRSSRLSWLQ